MPLQNNGILATMINKECTKYQNKHMYKFALNVGNIGEVPGVKIDLPHISFKTYCTFLRIQLLAPYLSHTASMAHGVQQHEDM